MCTTTFYYHSLCSYVQFLSCVLCMYVCWCWNNCLSQIICHFLRSVAEDLIWSVVKKYRAGGVNEASHRWKWKFSKPDWINCLYVCMEVDEHTYVHTNKQSQWRNLLARKKKCHFTFEKTVSGVTRDNEEAISYTYILTYIRTFLPPLTHSFIRIHTYILNIILFMHIKLLSFFICLDACMGVCMRVCAVQTWFDLSWTIHTLLPLINICILSCNLL